MIWHNYARNASFSRDLLINLGQVKRDWRRIQWLGLSYCTTCRVFSRSRLAQSTLSAISTVSKRERMVCGFEVVLCDYCVVISGKFCNVLIVYVDRTVALDHTT